MSAKRPGDLIARGGANRRGRGESSGRLRFILALLLFLPGAWAHAQPSAVVLGAAEVQVEGLDPGEVLLGELNCVACHRAPPRLRARLAPKQAPLLGDVAARVWPGFLTNWLSQPLAEKPGSTMPDVLHGLSPQEKAETVDLLAHYLQSLKAPPSARGESSSRLTLDQGRTLFHQVGCVACHAPFEPAGELFPGTGGGPTDPDAVRFVLSKLTQVSVPLGYLERKYRLEALSAFLRDPLQVRPSGRMPSLNLTEVEARALAAYLLRDQVPAALPPRVVDPKKVAQGARLFGRFGCAACHQLGGGRSTPASTLKAKSLMDLAPNATGGCLSASPPTGAPRFQLEDGQRAALAATLRGWERLRRPLAPKDQVARTMYVFNCFACHSREGVGGPSASRSDFFTTLTEADLGDEGRIPPHLTGVGDKLRPDWLREVLLKRGAVRPYMAVRMPQFGAVNVEPLAAAFERADAVRHPMTKTDASLEALQGGRRLLGVEGYSCISCHIFNRRKSLGISVMDLTWETRRLKKPWFERYLRDPIGLRPGTRMPCFFPDGKAPLQEVLGGDTRRQIDALWAYLSLGTNAPLPAGLQ